MPKIDWDPNSGGTGYRRVAPGAYVCRITKAEWRPNNFGEHELAVAVDIASGEFEGIAANTKTPWLFELTAGEGSTGKLTRVIDAIADSNPSFDARGAFERDQWEAFSGRGIGVVFAERERIDRDGKVRVDCKPTFAVPSAEALRGDVKVPDRYVPPKVANAKAAGAEYAYDSDKPAGYKEPEKLPAQEFIDAAKDAKAPWED